MTREEERQRIDKAHQNVADWMARNGGLSGYVRVQTQVFEPSGRSHNGPVNQAVIGDPVVARKIAEKPPIEENPPIEEKPKMGWIAWLIALFTRKLS